MVWRFSIAASTLPFASSLLAWTRSIQPTIWFTWTRLSPGVFELQPATPAADSDTTRTIDRCLITGAFLAGARMRENPQVRRNPKHLRQLGEDVLRSRPPAGDARPEPRRSLNHGKTAGRRFGQDFPVRTASRLAKSSLGAQKTR